MVHHGKALDALRETGYRLTPQRMMVLSVMAEHPGHIGVEEISRGVHQVYPYIDLATVYRTLQLLKRLHLVTELDVGGFARYELVETDITTTWYAISVAKPLILALSTWKLFGTR